MMDFLRSDEEKIYSRPIKQIDDKKRLAQIRLRKLQNLCYMKKLDAILFIPGDDGKYNSSSQIFCKYMFLGCSGRELEGDSYIQGIYEPIEECFFMITPNHFHVFYSTHASSFIVPILSTLEGVIDYTAMGGDDVDDMDFFEKRKIVDFITMVTQNVPLKAKIGFAAFPAPPKNNNNKDDDERLYEENLQEMVESFPLIQAFALDDFGNHGFFTMNYSPVNIYDDFHVILADIDANTVFKAIQNGVSNLKHHMRTVNKVINNDHTAISRLELTEADVVEPLQSVYEFGFIKAASHYDTDFKALPGHGARVLFGYRTNFIVDHQVESSNQSIAGTQIEKVSNNDGALHLTVEGEEPMTGLRLCRTYFLSIGKNPPSAPQDNNNNGKNHDDDEDNDDNDTTMNDYKIEVEEDISDEDILVHKRTLCLYQTYEKLVNALSSIENFPYQSKITIGQLKKELHTRFSKFLTTEKIDIYLDFTDSYGRSYDFSDTHRLDMKLYTVYLRAVAKDIQCDGINLGSVAVGDTFLFTSEESINHINGVVGPYENKQYHLLTGESCAPYYRAWVGCGTEDFNSTRMMRALQDNYTLRGVLQLGTPAGNSLVDAVMLLPDNHFPFLKGNLRLYANGFSLMKTGVPPIAICAKRDITSIKVVEMDMDGNAILVFRFKENTINPVSSVIPFNFTNDIDCCALVLRHGSRVLKEVFDQLAGWKLCIENSDIRNTESFDMPPEIASAYERSSNFFNFAELKNNKLLSMSRNLEAGLSLHDKYLQNMVYSTSKQQDEDKIPVNIIVGLPGSGVLDVATKVVEFSSDEVDWTHVKLNLTLLENKTGGDSWKSLITVLQAAEDSILKRRSRNSRILLSISGYFSCTALCLLVLQEFNKNLHIATVSSCVSATQLFRDADIKCISQRWLPSLWDQTTAGLVSNVILLDSDSNAANENEISEFRDRIFNRNNTAELLQANRSYLSPQVLEAIISLNGFSSTKQEEVRLADMGPYWKYVDYKTIGTGVSGDIEYNQITSSDKLDKQRFIRTLAEFFPKASRPTVIAEAVTSQNENDGNPGNEIGIRRIAQLAKMKVMDDQTLKEGMDSLTKSLKEITLTYQKTKIKSIYGNVQFNYPENQIYYFEASDSRITLIEAGKFYDPSFNKENKFSLIGRNIRSDLLSRLIKLAVPYTRRARPQLTRKDIDNDRVKKIIATHATTPLPEGWWYDGSAYVDWSGNRLYTRPDADTLVAQYLDTKNKEISEYNTKEGLV